MSRRLVSIAIDADEKTCTEAATGKTCRFAVHKGPGRGTFCALFGEYLLAEFWQTPTKVCRTDSCLEAEEGRR